MTALSPEAVSGFDTVIHLAGESVVGRWTPEKKKAIRDSRVQGTRNLATALARCEVKPRVLVCASAIGIYGDRGDEILREESSAGSGFLPEVCREWEQASGIASEAGIRTVNIRSGLVLSARGGALAKMLTPFKLGLGGRMGSGLQWMSWIHIDDIVGAIQHALDTESAASRLSGPVNLVSPDAVRNAEFTQVLASVLRRPAFFPVPEFGFGWLLARRRLGKCCSLARGLCLGSCCKASFGFGFGSCGWHLRICCDSSLLPGTRRCDSCHIGAGFGVAHWIIMGKKFIAAVLLAVGTWIEMALAPMLLMSGHLHSAAEVAEHGAFHHHVMPAGHACCPKIGATGSTEDSGLAEVMSGGLPCADEHRCCFRQGPQSVPAPVSAGQRLSQEPALAQRNSHSTPDSESHVFSAPEFGPGPPSGLLGMVIRV